MPTKKELKQTIDKLKFGEMNYLLDSVEEKIRKLEKENYELKDKIERLEGDLKEESTHYCCEKCDGCKKCGDCECDEEEKEELRKRIRELENDSSCKNCGAGKGRVGCGKDCFQDDDKRDT